jgi:hypothetical protein
MSNNNNNDMNLNLDNTPNDNKQKYNSFEYQYTPKNKISLKNIFNDYQENYTSYLEISNEIYNLIKNDVIEHFYKNKKNIGLKYLWEWKYLLSNLKLYIYSFYAIDNFNPKHKKFFLSDKMFKTAIKYYFKYPQNNIYQNIFVEIIKLICNEKCPHYLVKVFLKLNKRKRNKFLSLIINNLINDNKETKNNNNIIKEKKRTKNNLSNGPNLEILNTFYTSLNPLIINNFDKRILDNKIKDIFLKYVNPKFERQLDEDYEYSESEIFDSDNDCNNTFDGNDSFYLKEYESLKTVIDKFLKKYKQAIKDIKQKNDININDINSNNTIQQKISEFNKNYETDSDSKNKYINEKNKESHSLISFL